MAATITSLSPILKEDYGTPTTPRGKAALRMKKKKDGIVDQLPPASRKKRGNKN